MSDRDDRREFQELEAELRADQGKDPGDAFFADLEARVMREVVGRPVPRRPWWHPQKFWRWVWRPVPMAALAGAAAVALVVVWVGGVGGPSAAWKIPLPDKLVAVDKGIPVSPRPFAIPGMTPGEEWFARLPPTESLWALEDAALPALLALVSAEDPEEDEDWLVIPPGATVDDQALRWLTQEQLRVLERALDSQKTQQKRRPARPRSAMGKAG